MWGDKKPGVSRVDPIEHFQSNRGLRTAGFKKNRSQIVFGSDNATEKPQPRPKGRERGPGKEFGHFIERYGFPEKRPTSFSQKRLFCSNTQPKCIDVFESSVSSEMRVNHLSFPPSHAELPQPNPQQWQEESYAEDECQEERSGVYDEEDEIAANSVRLRLLEEALLLQRERLSTLKEKHAAERSRPMSQRGGPSFSERGSTHGVHVGPKPPWQTNADGHSEGSGKDATQKITETMLPSGAERCRPQQEEHTVVVKQEAVRRTNTRGRSTWSLASHYEGWK